MKTYTLNRAFRIVLRTESTPLRAEVFSDICDKNLGIRFVYSVYSALPGASLKAGAVLLYGIKCFLSLRLARNSDGDIVAAGTFVNEQRTVDEFRRLASGVNVRAIEVSNRNMLSAESWRALWAHGSGAGRLYRLCRRLVARSDFMPACRSFSVITYGSRLYWALAERPPAAALIPSSYAPDSMALAFAGHKSGAKVIYVNHAHIAPLFDYIAPVYADLSILTGRAVFETYSRRSHIQGDVIYKGFLSEENAISTSRLDGGSAKLSVGIFLTSMTDMQALEAFALALIDELPIARIVIRPHPVTLEQDDFAGLSARVRHVAIDRSRPLVDSAKDCDFVICGNSSVALEVLKIGVPVAYNSALDMVPADYCGFVAEGLVPHCGDDLAALPRRLVRFYRQEDWPDKMRYFDASYGKDAEAVRADVWRRVACGIR